jgi:hypothetical protein
MPRLAVPRRVVKGAGDKPSAAANSAATPAEIIATYPDQIVPTDGQPAPTSGLSSWINYTRPGCCGPLGSNGPINTELYAITGPSLPIGGGILGSVLDTGWLVKAGGRSLFFNSELTAAWTADIGLDYIYNHGKPDKFIPVLPRGARFGSRPTQSHLRVLNRTRADSNLGREWYIYVWPGDLGARWRAGFDVGTRLGTVRADFVEVPHRTDVLFGVDIGLHTDLEIPKGCCTFLVGFRMEWDHDWMDVLQSQNNSNLQDWNLLLNLGFRY